MRLMLRKHLMFLASALTLLLSSCGNNTQTTGSDDVNKILSDSALATQILNIDNSLYNIPSPHQFTKTLVDAAVGFDPSLTNPVQNVSQYSNSYKKALNMGIYGADLGYANMYERTQEAVMFFSAIKTLAQELGVINAFRKDTFEKIERNLNNEDSVMQLLASSYQDVDLFLRSNNQEHIGALILVGGWIESMHMLSSFALGNNNAELAALIGENKRTITNMILALTRFIDHNRIYATLIDKLIELEMVFQEVDVAYSYEKIEVKPSERLTEIKSQTVVTIPDTALAEMAAIIADIRKFATD